MAELTFTDINGKPLAAFLQEMGPLTVLSDTRIDELKRKLLDAKGDHVAAGVSPEDTRNLVYTLRMKAKPLQENTTEGVAKAKGKATKDAVPAIDINSMLE